MSNSIEHISKRIGHKDWNEVIEYWQNFLPSITFPIDEVDIEGSINFQLSKILDDIKNIENKSTEKNHYYHVPGIQFNIFSEAIYLFYKSLNSIKSAQIDQKSGYKTWSINNYYQSSYFSLKCFLNILGIFSCCINNNYLLVDLFPTYKKISKRDYINRRKVFELQIQRIWQFDHKENWTIYKRVINISNNLPVNEQILDLLLSIDPKNFTKQRNKIIYQNKEWIFEDLKQETIDEIFGIKDIFCDDNFTIDEHYDFTLFVSFLLLFLNFMLFYNISNNNEYFNNEFELIQKSMSSINNNIYTAFIDKNNTICTSI
jgi:hypothetical protein